MKFKSQISFAIISMLVSVTINVNAQLPTCNNIYMDDYSTPGISIPGFGFLPLGESTPTGNIYGYDPTLPVSTTNPSLNSISLPSNYIGGLTIHHVLGSDSEIPTFYCITGNMADESSWEYSYFNPTSMSWVNTGHFPGYAPNIAGGGDYLYAFEGAEGIVYRYDGTGDAIELLNVPGFEGEGPYDIIADCEGNFYVLNLTGNNVPPFLKKFNSEGELIQNWTVLNPNNYQSGAGFGILGNTIYVDALNESTGNYGMAYGVMNDETIIFDNITSGFSHTGITGTGAGESMMSAFYDLGSCAGAVPTDPTIDITSNPTEICEGQTILFNSIISSGGDAPQYQWFVNGVAIAGATNNTFSYAPTSEDVITCRLISNSVCVEEDTVMSDPAIFSIGIPEIPTLNYDETSYCKIGTTVPTYSPIGGYFESNLPGLAINTSTGEIDLLNSASGTYTITYTTSGEDGCPSQQATFTFSVIDNPNVNIQLVEPIGNICQGSQITLEATGMENATYRWTPARYFKETSNTQSIVYPTVTDASNIIKVEVFNEQGCNGEGTIWIGTVPCCDVLIPNVFSPNGDGKNDIWSVVSEVDQTIESIRIFDRWGKEVYCGFGNQAKWDGKSDGIDMPQAVYFYHLVYMCSGNRFEHKGDITLVR